jgi:phosphonate transport system ATP-binding protein
VTAPVTEAVARLSASTFAAAPGTAAAVLRNVDLQIDDGEQIAVIGASGAGKTTLLLALACALRPLQGQIEVFGADPWAMTSSARQKLRAALCLAPQVPPLPPRQRTVTAVLAGALPAMGLLGSVAALWQPGANPRRIAQVQAALVSLDLPDQIWHRVDRLSGGERQRVGLARLLVSGARLWLVDEPLSALDPARAQKVMDVLTESARREQRTLVCSLHQVAVARERFGRVLALRGGELIYDGPGQGLSDSLLTALYGPGWAAATLADPAAATEAAVATAASPVLDLPEAMCR